MKTLAKAIGVFAAAVVGFDTFAFRCDSRSDATAQWQQLLGTGVDLIPGAGASLSMATTTCQLTHEPPVKRPEFYAYCPHRDFQHHIAEAGRYFVPGLQYRRAQGNGVAKVGSSRFGLQNRLRIYDTSTQASAAKAGHGIDVLLFGKRLKLPPQRFELAWVAAPHAQSTYLWKSLDAKVKFEVPTPIGAMKFRVEARNQPRTISAASRASQYNALLSHGTENVKHDWLPWFPATADALEGQAALDLSTYWSLDVLSPRLGVGVPGASASMRLGLKGSATGELSHANRIDTFNFNDKVLTIRTFTDNHLKLNPALNAYLRAKIEFPFLSYTKTWKLFSASAATAVNEGPSVSPINPGDTSSVTRGLLLTSCKLTGAKAVDRAQRCPRDHVPKPIEAPPGLGKPPALDDPEPRDFFTPWVEGIVTGPQTYLKLCFDDKRTATQAIGALLQRANELGAMPVAAACAEIREKLSGLKICDSYSDPSDPGPKVWDSAIDEQCGAPGTETQRDSLPEWANM